jgi:hypothetical protein
MGESLAGPGPGGRAAHAYLLQRRPTRTAGAGHRGECRVVRPARSSGGSAGSRPLPGGAPAGGGVVNRLLTARDAEPGNG